MRLLIKTLLILPIILNQFLYCEELPDDMVGRAAIFERTFPFKDRKQMALDPNFNSNFYHANQEMLAALAKPDTDYVYGMGDKEYIVTSTNFVSNVAMAGAKTDPRGLEFVDKSLVSSLKNLHGESEGMAELGKMQLGDSTERYMQGEVIEPNIGMFQTADNEQAFQSAYDNLMLGKAEQALYEGDRISATSHFEDQSQNFKTDTDKQMNASAYQRDGILRNKETAETFRDFFSYKSDVTSSNLALMPTPASLLQNCRQNTRPGEDLLGVYNMTISQSERDFYHLTPPDYSNVDFCESYIHFDESILIKNIPVQEKLADINQKSLQMASGLDDIVKTLSNQGLSNAELAAYLANNPTWNELKDRQLAFEECKKKNCLSVLEAKIKSVIDYPGADDELAPEHKAARLTLAQMIASKKLVASISGHGSSRDYSKVAAINLNGLRDVTGPSHSLSANKRKGHINDQFNSVSGPGTLDGNTIGAYDKSTDASYYKQLQQQRRNGVFFRNESGLLVGPSGKAVMGNANPAHLDIFQIISSRYQKKFFSEDVK